MNRRQRQIRSAQQRAANKRALVLSAAHAKKSAVILARTLGIPATSRWRLETIKRRIEEKKNGTEEDKQAA